MIELKILFNPATGEVNFSGPADNRMLMYGLLGVIQELIIKNSLKPEPLVQPAHLVPQLVR